MARALRAWAIKGRKKTRSITCRTDRADEANKRYVKDNEPISKKKKEEEMEEGEGKEGRAGLDSGDQDKEARVEGI